MKALYGSERCPVYRLIFTVIENFVRHFKGSWESWQYREILNRKQLEFIIVKWIDCLALFTVATINLYTINPSIYAPSHSRIEYIRLIQHEIDNQRKWLLLFAVWRFSVTMKIGDDFYKHVLGSFVAGNH